MSTQSQFYTYNPEKRNVFMQVHGGRTNHLINLTLGFFAAIISPTCSIVEVFLRKNFGQRYITLSQSIFVFIVVPPLLTIGFDEYGMDVNVFSASILFLFMCVYLWKSIQHRKEITKYGTAYDFKRFSLSDCELAPFWDTIIGK